MLSAAARQAIDRLSRVDAAKFDPQAAERALRRHFAALDLPWSPVYWVPGGIRAYLTLFAFPRSRDDWHMAYSAAQRRAKFSAIRALSSSLKFEEWQDAQNLARWTVWQADRPARQAGDAAWRAIRRILERSALGRDLSPIQMCHGVDYAADAAAAANVLDVFDDAAGRKLVEVSSPLIDAYEAGLLLFSVRADALICVPRPLLHRADNRLHRRDGPAVEWPRELYWFWQGVEVPRCVIEEPTKITVEAISRERDHAVRRCMIECMGGDRLIQETKAELVAQSTFGKLWHCRLDGLHAIAEVQNGTIGPDGFRNRYFLRVPPHFRTVQEAVAWTYGLAWHEYELAERT